MPDPTITLRLLAAARHAYEVDADGVVPNQGWPPDPYGFIRYTDQPIGFRAGADNQDGGFVATIPEGVVVSIRGTTPPRLFGREPMQVVVDWASDAVASLVNAGNDGFPGRVHLGFYKCFMRLWQKLGPAVHTKVTAAKARTPGAATIFVTGHSKGGPVSALVAWRLKKDFPDANIVVRTFAGARIGDAVFAAKYNQAIPNHIRYEYDDDIVPHLPLAPEVVKDLGLPWLVSALLSVSDVGYGQVGALRFIRPGGAIVADSAELEKQRVAALTGRAEKFGGFAYIVDCHAVDPPHAGYFTAAYANGADTPG